MLSPTQTAQEQLANIPINTASTVGLSYAGTAKRKRKGRLIGASAFPVEIKLVEPNGAEGSLPLAKEKGESVRRCDEEVG